MPGPTDRADGFDVVPAALRGAAGTFVAEADALTSATASLQRHLGSLGAAPWGADHVGVRFGTAYQPAADAVTLNLGALAQGLARISGALVAVADRYEQADLAAAAVPPIVASDGRSGTASPRTTDGDAPVDRGRRELADPTPGAPRGQLP